MPTDASTATGGTSQSPQTAQAVNIGSTQAQIDNLAGGLSNTNVNGTVGPNFFVARLNDEAMTLALYGWLKSDKCCLGLQGKVQLPEEKTKEKEEEEDAQEAPAEISSSKRKKE